MIQYSKKSVEELEKIVDADPNAAYELGLRYYAGMGIDQDLKKAFMLFRSAGNAGHAGAMYLRGLCHQKGHGIWQDHERAVKWFMRSALLGNRLAMYELGEAYFYGNGVGQNTDEAIKWYKASAEAGHGMACYKLGELLRENLDEALRWFTKGGRLGNDPAAFTAGVLLIYKEEYEQALEFLRISADLGNEDAYYYLSEMYRLGIGVEKNQKLAKELFEKSNRMPDEPDGIDDTYASF